MSGKRDPKGIPEWLEDKLANVKYVVGADECGWGSVAGPIVVAACVLPTSYEGPRLRDSKKYSTEAKRREAELVVKEHCWRYEVASLSATALVVAGGPAEALRLCYCSAIATVTEGMDPDEYVVVIDGKSTIPDLGYKHYALVKGDDRVQAIAAASIIGKVWRDNYMTEIGGKYPDFTFAQHKGYPTGHHYEEMRRFGVTLEHRRNIGYVQEMLEKTGKYESR